MKDVAAQINELARDIYKNAENKGFWDDLADEKYDIPRRLTLIHSEISEALSEHHNGKRHWQERFGTELADAVIRLFDLATGYGYNIGDIIVAKHQKNLERPHKHGKRY